MSGFCDFCHVWHSSSCYHHGQAQLTALRQRVETLEQRQAWIDQVGPPLHPDDERQWVLAYLTAQTQLTAVTQELDKLKSDIAFLLNFDAANALTKQKAKLQALEGALRKYGRHGTTAQICAATKHSDYACDCGLEAALQGEGHE